MTGLFAKPDLEQKLDILSTDGQYDLACACGTTKDDRRHRGQNGKWIYPVTLPNGGKSVIFKSLLSNVCSNDCKYCPLRKSRDLKRCSLDVDEISRAFLEYYYSSQVFGLFLSSGVIGTPDNTMDQLCGVAQTLRKKYNFRGYIHLKIIPGASDAAVERAAWLASAVSVNIEVPGPKRMEMLSAEKNFVNDIIRPMKLLHKIGLERQGGRKVKQSTQFIVGAAGETDQEIVKYTSALYDRLDFKRVYFSAYQDNLGDRNLNAHSNDQNFIREHRLYQVDFLMRKYGFGNDDIFYDEDGHLSLEKDPKQVWATAHPEFFPVKVNTASKNDLLKVPGLGPVTVSRILTKRKSGKITCLEDIAKPGKLLCQADKYIIYN